VERRYSHHISGSQDIRHIRTPAKEFNSIADADFIDQSLEAATRALLSGFVPEQPETALRMRRRHERRCAEERRVAFYFAEMSNGEHDVRRIAGARAQRRRDCRPYCKAVDVNTVWNPHCSARRAKTTYQFTEFSCLPVVTPHERVWTHREAGLKLGKVRRIAEVDDPRGAHDRAGDSRCTITGLGHGVNDLYTVSYKYGQQLRSPPQR